MDGPHPSQVPVEPLDPERGREIARGWLDVCDGSERMCYYY